MELTPGKKKLAKAIKTSKCQISGVYLVAAFRDLMILKMFSSLTDAMIS